MFLLREYQGQIQRFIQTRSRRAFIMAWAAVLGCLICLTAIFLLIGAPISTAWPFDTMMFLDGGWRLLHGQVPHRDFYLIWGELPIFVSWFAMKLGHFGVGALTFGNLFVMWPAGLATMILLQRRTGAFYAALFAVFVALLASAPRSLGDSYELIGYAMVYNRYGEAFLTLLGIIIFVPILPGTKRGAVDWIEAVFGGLLLFLLLISKISYFAVGVAFCALGCLRGRRAFAQGTIMFLCGAVFALLFYHLTHISVSLVVHDYKTMMAAQIPGQKMVEFIVAIRRDSLALALLLMLVWEFSKKQSGLWKAWPYLIVVAFIYISDMALGATNAKAGEYALLGLPGLACAELIRRQNHSSDHETIYYTVRNLVALLVLLILIMPTLGQDLMSIRRTTYATLKKRYSVPETLRGTRLADLRFPTGERPRRDLVDFAVSVDDGMKLLRRHADPQMRLAVFCFSNPFHLALDLAPQRGGVLCWFFTSITARSHPPLSEMVGDANYILTDTGQGDYLDFFGSHCEDSYGAEWKALPMQLVEQTKYFRLYKLR